MVTKARVLEFLEKQFRESGETAQATQYRMLPKRDHEMGGVVVPPSLLEVETRGVRSLILLVPGGGGHVFSLDGQPVQVLTAQSPLGSALLGQKEGATVVVEIGAGIRQYRILRMS